jgi:large conductance mechanosensitive channel
VLKEFKDFILRGNVVDLAVAVVVGTAFALVVKAMVEDFVTPLIAAAGGEPDFSALDFTINGSTFRYGHFVNEVISFLIIAAVVFFFIVKPVNFLIARHRREQAPQSPPEDVMLLREIRDLMKERGGAEPENSPGA